MLQQELRCVLDLDNLANKQCSEDEDADAAIENYDMYNV